MSAPGPVSRISLATLDPAIPFVPAVSTALAKAAREAVGDNPRTDHFTRAAHAYAEDTTDDPDTVLALWKDVTDAAHQLAPLLPNIQGKKGVTRQTPYVETEIVLAATSRNHERMRLLLQNMNSQELIDYRKALQRITEAAGRIVKHRQQQNSK